jgi:multicomponent Na+:H+ antiporter subunit G
MDFIIISLLIIGAIFILLSGIGLIRMPDLYTRMSATTKASTLGVGCVVLGTVLYFGEIGLISRGIIIILFITLTAPVAAHMIGRAAYIQKTPLWKGTMFDHLKDKYDDSTHELK